MTVLDELVDEYCPDNFFEILRNREIIFTYQKKCKCDKNADGLTCYQCWLNYLMEDNG